MELWHVGGKLIVTSTSSLMVGWMKGERRIPDYCRSNVHLWGSCPDKLFSQGRVLIQSCRSSRTFAVFKDRCADD